MGKASGKARILTGDRTTGSLHIGHYVGSLMNRVRLQETYETFLILADVQALTTHFEHPEQLRQHVYDIAVDYLAAGINPDKATIFVQSRVPEIAELTVFYSMFVTVNSLRHNPTVRHEAADRGYDDLYYGFLGYPVSQAADITFCKATLVPVGDDQLPHIEQTRKIVRRFNELYAPVLVEPEALIGEVPRLAGLDADSKMSKSKGNAILLSDDAQTVRDKVHQAKTDPARIHPTDPGHPHICPIFAYHQAFDSAEAPDIEARCQAGTIGCVACKTAAAAAINGVLEPMRQRRQAVQSQPRLVDEVLHEGTRRARQIAQETMAEVREAMGMDYVRLSD